MAHLAGLPAEHSNWDVRRTVEKLVNHSPSSFSCVLQTPRVGYFAGKTDEYKVRSITKM